MIDEREAARLRALVVPDAEDRQLPASPPSAKTKIPITIDGKPFRTSSQSFTWSASARRRELAHVDRDEDADGSAIAVAIQTSMRVPTIAGAIPPPVSPNTPAP